MPDAYERLVMDVIRGDQTLFMRGDEVEAAWAWVDPIIRAWEDGATGRAPYDPGSSGPGGRVDADAPRRPALAGDRRDEPRSAGPEIIRYPSRDAMAEAVAADPRRPPARPDAPDGPRPLAVPGGTTPGPMLSALGHADLPWAGSSSR